MRLSEETHRQVEEFMREHFGDPSLRLPRISVAGGRLARFVTKTFRIGAITLGRHVVVSPAWLKKDGAGRWTVPGWLLAHEGAHVLQYREAGFVRFLFNYLREYAAAMREGRFKARAHKDAYLNLSSEVEARAVEEAYTEWLRKREEGKKEEEKKEEGRGQRP